MEKEQVKLVIVGHVDHGKSTLIGRLLYNTDSLPEGVFEEVKKICEELGKPVEFAYILDSLEEERQQNVTIDTTQIVFRTEKRDYIIIDAPGHVEFLKNMITGSSQAEAAVLIIDAKEGLQEQTKRHAYILSMLNIPQLIVLINKMDTIEHDESKFNQLKQETLTFLEKLDLSPNYIIPVSAKEGDNITTISDKMPWYDGISVLNALDSFKPKENNQNTLLRFPIQDVYKFDEKRILVGRVETGKLKVGEEIKFLPSNKTTTVKSIEVWNRDKSEAEAGECIGITLNDHLFVERGEILCSDNSSKIVSELEANIFWMSNKSIKTNEKVILKCATQETACVIKRIKNKINSSSLELIDEDSEELNETEVGNVVIQTEKQIVVENFNEIEELGRFVLIKDDDIVGGGIINEISSPS